MTTLNHILVTNEDGVTADVLLVQGMRKLAKIRSLAPDRNWSGGEAVSITPQQLDLTMYAAIPTIGDWGWERTA